MGLQKPTKNKAPANVAPVGGYHPQSKLDPCCIPVSTPPLLSNSGGGSAPEPTHHIKTPTAH